MIGARIYMFRRRLAAVELITCSAFIWIVLAAIPARPQSPQKPASKAASAQEKTDPLAPLLQQANDAIEKTDFTAALDPLEKYIAQRPDDPYAHFQLGYALAGLKRSADAKTEFSRAVDLDPKMAAAHLNLGLVLMDTDPGAAAQSFLRAAELQPTESRPRFLAGFSFEQAGKLSQAAEQYRAALAIAPGDYENHFALGHVLLRSGNASGAEEQFQQAVAARSNSAPARLGLANALQAQKKYDAASDALDQYLKLNPADRAAHFDRASALLNLDRYDEALTELDRSETGSAATDETRKMRAEILMRQQNWKGAAELLTQALQLAPRDLELAMWLGRADVELRDFPAAINILVQVSKQEPENADALRSLTEAFFLSQDYPDTLAAMDQLAKLEALKPMSWFVRAICYDKLSHKIEAIDAYQKFLDQDNGEHDTEDFQARHRILTLQGELGQSKKK